MFLGSSLDPDVTMAQMVAQATQNSMALSAVWSSDTNMVNFIFWTVWPFIFLYHCFATFSHLLCP